MDCPKCGSKMVKQPLQDENNELEVTLSMDNGFAKEFFDVIIDWYKCGMSTCPMAVYISNESH